MNRSPMPPRSAPMRRTPIVPAQATPLARAGIPRRRAGEEEGEASKPARRLRNATPQRARDLRAYTARQPAWKAAHPTCAVRDCGQLTQECHHAAGRRGWRLLHEPWWVPLCSPCHRHVTEHPTWAEAEGYSLPRSTTREDIA